MKLTIKPYILISLVLLLLSSSCVSRKNIAYFQGLDNQRSLPNNVEIQPDDLLTIRVSAPEQAAVVPFNLTKSVGSMENMGNANVELETYMVSNEGTVDFPVLGTINVGGLTSIELANKLEQDLKPYVQNPLVNVRILNFKVSVLGEVRSPGLLQVSDDYISLPQALAMAGDISITGKRTNILVMREGEDGKKTHAYLDITDADIINSPFYNLQQNDVIYVEPISAQRQAASYLGITSRYLSIASFALSILLLILN